MAVLFNNVADYYSRTTNLPASSENFTFCCWFRKLSATNTYKTLFGMQDAGITAYMFFSIEPDSLGGRLFMVISTGAGSTTVLLTPTLNTWYFAYLKCQGSAGADFEGGFRALGDTTVTSFTDAPNSFVPATIFIGGDSDGEFFDGHLAAVKLWDVGNLTHDELYAESTQVRARRRANLHAEYPCLGATNAQIDLSGNAHDLTVNGTMDTADNPPIAWDGARRRRIYIPAPVGGGGPLVVGGELTHGALIRGGRVAA